MSFEPNKTRDCKYFVYNQSKTGCTSSRLIQMEIQMLPGEILISVWLLLVWYDMEWRLIWCRNFSNESGNAIVNKTEFPQTLHNSKKSCSNKKACHSGKNTHSQEFFLSLETFFLLRKKNGRSLLYYQSWITQQPKIVTIGNCHNLVCITSVTSSSEYY